MCLRLRNKGTLPGHHCTENLSGLLEHSVLPVNVTVPFITLRELTGIKTAYRKKADSVD